MTEEQINFLNEVIIPSLKLKAEQCREEFIDPDDISEHDFTMFSLAYNKQKN